MGLLPKNIKVTDVPHSKKLKPIEPNQGGANKSRKLNNGLTGINTNHYKLVPLEKWSIKHFKEYFYDKYLDHVDMPHPRNESKHKGMMSRVLENLGGNKELLKRCIDTFFEIGYDNKTLEWFSTSTRLGEIQTYLTTGKKPFYLKDNDQTIESQGPVYKGKKLDQLLGGDE